MIAITVQDICKACEGELIAGSPAVNVSGVSTDTRSDVSGSLFIGLTGEHFDGGEFVDEALRKGAMGVIAAEGAARRLADRMSPEELGEAVVIAVEDPGKALKCLGALAGELSGARIVAITGSSGKTSTKDILAGLLRPRIKVVAGIGSFNNEVGVPLTLLEADSSTDVIIVEMGMQAPGEISQLCNIATPDIAVITNIGPSHLEFSGSLENIAAGKAEIAVCLRAGGGLVVPYQELLLEPHLKDLDADIVTFGFDMGADIHPISETIAVDKLHAVIDCHGAEIEIEFNFAGRHHLLNAMAAIGVYHLLGMPLEALSRAAAGVDLSRHRGEHLELAGGVILINDCYNANPLSMEVALEHLARTAAGGRAIAVLGDMGELGDEAQVYHRKVGRVAARLGVDLIVAVGESAIGYLEGAAEEDAGRSDRHHPGWEDAISELEDVIHPGDVVLVKASRFMRLERIADALAKSPVNQGGASEGGDSPTGGKTGKGG